jgi:hypothetical protein
MAVTEGYSVEIWPPGPRLIRTLARHNAKGFKRFPRLFDW